LIHYPANTIACGHVSFIGGSRATIRLDCAHAPSLASTLCVGGMVQIRGRETLAIAVVTSVSEDTASASGDLVAQVDLMGELLCGADGTPFFQRGISEYPPIRSKVELLGDDHLRLIHDVAARHTIRIGSLTQDRDVPAYVNIDEMLEKHFAVLGTTGVGKSTGVALMLREVLHRRPAQRIFLIDPHNEYANCFGNAARVLSPDNLRLPFWLFNFEEIVDAIFKARPGVEEEIEILAQAIIEAKNVYADERDTGRLRLRRIEAPNAGYTVDTPVPYRLTDLLAVIDQRMGKLESRSDFPYYHRLMMRIESLNNDPRYRFMFENANLGGDTMVETIARLFNLDEGEKQVTVMQLAGFPAEVVDSVVSVLCRMAFDFGVWSGGAVPLLVVCEEAHRYAPSAATAGFGPTKKAVSRIAKEGRKYGLSLGLVTQRPADLDPTIISQCNTLFVMRMANDRDQAIVRAAVSDAASSLLAFLPSLGVREVFAFGEGVALPTRVRFGELDARYLPKPFASDGLIERSGTLPRGTVAAIVNRWRRGGMSGRHATPYSEEPGEAPGAAADNAAPRYEIPPVLTGF
jgi:uncharacterized protein